jgi:RHS repeat-associated protein
VTGTDPREGGSVVDPFRSKVLSLVHTTQGWRAYPGRAAGAVRLADPQTCVGEIFFFERAGSGQDKLGMGMFPEAACRGETGVSELGRRRPMEGTGQGGWSSLLTDPRGETQWSFGPDGPTLVGPDWQGNPSAFPGPEDCQPFDPTAPDPSCVEALSRLGEGGPPLPNCTEPWYHRSSYTPWPDALGPGVGCGFDIPPNVPPPCIDERYVDAAAIPHPSHFQPIVQATVVEDATGTSWTYYGERAGRILRFINNESGARVDRNFDSRQRLLGERSAYGDRACFQYDQDSNPVQITALPAPGAWAPVPEIKYRRSFGPYGRVLHIWDPDQPALSPLVSFVYDAQLNIERVEYPQTGHAYVSVRDNRGRLTQLGHPNGSSTRIDYDPVSALWQTITFDDGGSDERRRVAARNPLGQILQLNEEGRPVLEWTWSQDGRLLSETVQQDPDAGSTPVTTTYGYDAAGQLETIDNPARAVEFTYNSQGLIESVREQSQGETRSICFQYDGRGELIEVIDPEGRRTHWHRDANGGVVRIERGVWAGGGAWEAFCAGNLADSLSPQTELFAEMTRDLAGRLTRRELGPASAAGARQSETFDYRYDGFGRLAEVQLSNGVRYRAGHSPRGLRTWSAAYRAGAGALPNGVVAATPDPADPFLAALSMREFDYLGRVLKQRDLWFVDDPAAGRQQLTPGGWLESRVVYRDTLGRIEVTGPNGYTTAMEADTYGRPVRIEMPDGVTSITQGYANQGRTVTRSIAPAVADGNQLDTVFHFRAHGGLARVEDGTGELLQEVTFDHLGRATRVVRRDQTFEYQYGPFGALSSILRVHGDGSKDTYESFSYDRNGALRGIDDAGGAQLRRMFDHANRVSSEEYAGGTRTQLGYFSGTSQVSDIIDRNGEVRSYGYDGYGQVSSIDATNSNSSAGWATGSRLTFSWGVLGLESATAYNAPGTSDDVSLTYLRDSKGNVVEERSSLFPAEPVRFRHDPLAQTTMVHSGAFSIQHSRDPLGRVRQVGRPGAAAALADYRYNGYGGPDSITFANGLTEDFGYDEEGRLLSAVVSGPVANFRHDYYWGADGNLARVDRQLTAGGPAVSNLYRADDLGRLTGAGHGLSGVVPMISGSVSPQAIDGELSRLGQTERFSYDAVENWTAADVNGAQVSPATGSDHRYRDFNGLVDTDAEGRVLQLANGAQYGYDGLGRMAWAQLAGATRRNFLYDALGHLVGWTGDEDVRFQYAGDNLLREERTGSPGVFHIPGAGMGPVAVESVGQTAYNHFTFGERLSVVTDQSGGVLEHLDYSSYGRPTFRGGTGAAVLPASTSGNRLLIAGEPYLSGFDLHRFGQRMYLPEMGRFLSQDPFGFIDGSNRYTYGRANPIQYLDPSGTSSQRADSGLRGPMNGFGPGECPACDDLFRQIGRNVAPFATYRGWIETFQGALEHYTTALGDWLHDITGSVFLAGTVKTGLDYVGGAPIGIAGIGLLPEQLIDSPDRLGHGASEIVSGLEEGNLYKALQGTAEVSGEIGTWAGIGAGVAGAAKGRAPAGRGRPRNCVGGQCGPSGVCFTAGTEVQTAAGAVAIETLQVGDRVLAPDGATCRNSEVHADDWRLLELEMPNPDGSDDTIEIIMLHPAAELRSRNLEAEGYVDLNFAEIGLAGRAQIRAIKPASSFPHTPGCLVLTTLTHWNAEVLEIRFRGEAEILEPTARHRLFSADRSDWVAAKDLRVGERLKTEWGEVEVASIQHKPGVHRVYNIEVDTQHAYLVSDLQVWSHNAGDCGGVEYVDPRILKPRQILGLETSTGHVERLKKSILKDGFDASKPILVAEDGASLIILDGHHRQRAAILAKQKRVPILRRAVSESFLQELRVEVANAALWWSEYFAARGRQWGMWE